MLDPPALSQSQVASSFSDGSGDVRLLLAAPRGFCAGVRRAIDAVLEAIELHGPPVYVRRPIVHNLQVVRDLEARGAIFIEELDQAPPGSTVLFSAHGVSPEVSRSGSERELITYDAVCPLVAKVHREVERHDRDGRQIVIIGHAGHPEMEGTVGYAQRGGAHVVNSVSDVAALPLDPAAPTAFAVQTTYSVDDAAEIVRALEDRFSNLRGPASSDICYATTNRQQAVRAVAARSEAVIVVGEGFSSNARRLLEVAAAISPSVQMIAAAHEIDWSPLEGATTIGVTAAASTPESSVEAVIEALGRRFRLTIEEVETARETTVFKPLHMG